MFHLKKLIGLLLAIVLVASVFTGCGSTGKGNSSSNDEIKIGLNFELSGQVATYGQSTVDGIMLAFNEINAAGGILGKKIVPVKMDNKSDSAEATNVATRLITQDKVVAVLGPATSGNTKATVPVGTKNLVPIISASATADDVTVDAKGVKEYVFRICYNDSFQGTTMANYASKKLNAKNAIILIDNASDYSKGLAKNFKDTFTKNGGTIVDEEAYVAGNKDYNAVLTKIKDKTFDVIFLPGYYGDVGLIIKQARGLGIQQPVLGGDGFDSPKLAEIAGNDALNNVFFSNHYSSLDQDPAVVKFIENYKKAYNTEPNAFNALGYDQGYFIADAIKRAGEANSIKIKEALASTKDFAGITGTLSVDENHNPVKAIVVIELKNGAQASSEKIQP